MPRLSKPAPERPELERRLVEAKGHRLTPAERWWQRVSFAYGNCMECEGVTREMVVRIATELYGPRRRMSDGQ